MTKSDTRTEGETRKQIAERTVREWIEHDLDDRYEAGAEFIIGMPPAQLLERIESALNAERERCAKIADKYVADMRSVKQRTEYGEGCLNAGVYIADAIRKDQG